MVELIVTIAIAGLLAAVAIPRFVSRDAIDSRGFHDLSLTIVRYAQKTAIAWRRDVFVCVGATTVTAGTAAGCGTPLTNPVTGASLAATAPAGVSLAPMLNLRFDALGRPSSAAVIAFTSSIAGDVARQIVVEAETGYVHP